jgi:hypothetical protein
VDPGWYPDPTGRYEHRYFNGHDWTGDASDGGERVFDPYPPVGRSPALGVHPAAGAIPASLTAPGARKQSNGLAISAMVLGIVGCAVAFSILFFPLAAILGALAIVFGAAGRRHSRELPNHAGRGQSLTGIITGAAAILLAAGAGLLYVTSVRHWLDDLTSSDPGPYHVAQTSCARDGNTATFEGEITNQSGGRRSYRVTVRFVDAAGAAIGDDLVYVDTVRKGESAPIAARVEVDAPGGVASGAISCDVTDVERTLRLFGG